MTSSCCPGELCPGGQVCLGQQCGACTGNADCGQGNQCCNGVCIANANCCSSADCAPYVCRSNSCSTCSSDAECGAGAKCCGGACLLNAACCLNADCPAGQACLKGKCSACTKDSECGSSEKCCNGQCKQTNCCSSVECGGGLVCGPFGCANCTGDAQCAPGQKCCNGLCVNGICCNSTQCAAGQQCINNGCKACTTNAQCSGNEVCCGGSCRPGTCCSNADCDGLICEGNACRACKANAECGQGARCCNGTCYPSTECCTSADCSGGRTCKSGKCQSCTTNADCPGQQCCNGSCAPFCENSRTWDTDQELSFGKNENLACSKDSDCDLSKGQKCCPSGGCLVNCPPNQTSLDVACGVNRTQNTFPDGTLCLSQVQKVEQPFLWVPVNYGGDNGKAVRFNTRTGAMSPQYPTLGSYPSRTSVDPTDGSLWVANRSGSQNITHIMADGSIGCSVNVTRASGWSGRGVSLDAKSNVWVAASGEYKMKKFDKNCKFVAEVSGLPDYVYGAGLGDGNLVWTLGVSNGSIMAINANNNTFRHWRFRPSGCSNGYGMTVDADYVWVAGGWSCPGVVRCRIGGKNGPPGLLDQPNGANVGNPICTYIPTGGIPRGIAVAAPDPVNGKVYVYAATYSGNGVAQVDRDNASFVKLISTGRGAPIAASVDKDGRLWAIDGSGAVDRFDNPAAANPARTYIGSIGGEAYAYTDLTGMQATMAALIPGRWSGIHDAQYATPRWRRVEVTGKLPPDTAVFVRARSADNVSLLSSTPWSAEFPVPANLSSIPAKRFIEVEVKLQSNVYSSTPVVDKIQLYWGP
ncbi:MAG: hypothetical protein RL653_695 [Pseudomonadota bacterium]